MKRISEQHHNQHAESRFDFREYWRIIWRKRLLILLPIFVATAIAGVGSRFLKPVFQSTALIRVEDRQFLSSEVARFVDTPSRQRTHDQGTLGKIKAEIERSQFQDELIRRLELQKVPSIVNEAELEKVHYPHLTTEELVFRQLRGLLQKKSGVKLVGPGLFQIYFHDAHPEACYAVADAMSELFVERHKRQLAAGAREASEFSDDQVALYKSRLEDAEAELEKFKSSMVRTQANNNPVNAGNVRIAESKLSQLRIDMSDKRDLVSKLLSNLTSGLGQPPPGSPVWSDGRVSELQSQLNARAEEGVIIHLSGDPERVENENEQRETQGAIQRYLGDKVRSEYTSVSEDYKPLTVEYFYQQILLRSLEHRERRLAGAISSYRSQQNRVPQQERELTRLEQAVHSNRELYNTLQRAKASAQMTEAVQTTNLGLQIEVVEEPVRPIAPVRPDKKKLIALAFMLGGFISVAALIISEYSDTSFRTVDDIEKRLGLTVLGTIPRATESPEGLDPNVKRRRITWAAVSVAITVASIIGFYYWGKLSEKQAIRMTENAIQETQNR